MNKAKKLVKAVRKGIEDPAKVKKAMRVLMNEGPQALKSKVSMNVSGEMPVVHVKRVKLRNYSGDIKFSVVMPVYNVEIRWLEAAIASIEKQNYKNWEICIADDCSTKEEVRSYLKSIESKKIKVTYLAENQGISGATNAAAELATGDYILLMDNDDELVVNAMDAFYQAIKRENPDVLYSDMDMIDAEGNAHNPLLKPDWSPDLLLSQMYIGHLLGFRRSLFVTVGGFRAKYNGAQDYDLMLRMWEETDKICHVPGILYHWRELPSSTAANPESKPYAQTAGLCAVQDHLDRVYGTGYATANETENLFVYDVRYALKEEPKVSLIIPTRDHVDLLEDCIQSILEKTTYGNFEIVLLNNGSTEEASFAYFNKIAPDRLADAQEYAVQQGTLTTSAGHSVDVKIVDATMEFNWSKLNNLGMKMASGDVYVCMNNDMAVITPDWLTRMVEKAVRPEVGIVGALLLYEDQTIQHAGVVPGMGGWADHVFKNMKPVHQGAPFVSPMVTRNVSAVTGACMAFSKKTVEMIGGFDENFIICGSDIELALRASAKGLYNIYDPNVRIYHYESKSRDSYIPKVDFDLSDKMYREYRKNGDPFYNKNLDYFSCQPHAKAVVYIAADDKAVQAARVKKKREAGLPELDVNVHEIVPYIFREQSYKNKRMNLLVPSINTCHVFGGIATALKFYDRVLEATGYDARIILVDAMPDKEARLKYEAMGYTFVKAGENSDAPKQIVAYSDRLAQSIPVSKNDYFMLTGWWTAYCVQDAYVEFEQKYGIAANPLLYFIQDYEPGFYPWSTRFMLADSTYRSPMKTIAVFNSMLLKEYFDKNGYEFYQSFAFDPVLNDGLRKALEELPEEIEKKKRIIVYGRPGTERNAFNLVVAALRKWVCLQPDYMEWEVLSAGEMHRSVPLGNGMELVSVGKLTIEEYAKLLEESYAGISLMCSPHPSYPPLEMSVFGVRTITNTYGNKDLASFNDSMVSLSNVSPANIAAHLHELCKAYTPKVARTKANELYVHNEHVFDFVNDIKEILENDRTDR